jgi:hypothetical protein
VELDRNVAAAIKHSIETEGLTLYKKLWEKKVGKEWVPADKGKRIDEVSARGILQVKKAIAVCAMATLPLFDLLLRGKESPAVLHSHQAGYTDGCGPAAIRSAAHAEVWQDQLKLH